MSRYILAPRCPGNLVAIRDYYAEGAGYRIARQMLLELTKAFQTIAHTPGIGHKREDLAGDRPVVFSPMRDYLIVYRATAKPEIITIVRGSRDVAVILRRRE